MKLKLLSVFLFFTAFNSFGQTKKAFFGASISADWNTYLLVQDQGAFDYKGRPNFSAGALMRYHLSNQFSLDGGLYFSTKNYKEKIDFSKYLAITPEDPLLTGGKTAQILHNQQFLDIPVALNYNFIRNNQTDYYLSLGVVGSTLLSYQHKGSSKGLDKLSNNIPYNDFLGSIKIGIGTFLKTDKFGVNVEPQIRWFITEVHKEAIKENPVHVGIQVSVLKR
jgi:hypothetical protein